MFSFFYEKKKKTIFYLRYSLVSVRTKTTIIYSGHSYCFDVKVPYGHTGRYSKHIYTFYVIFTEVFYY